MSFEPPAKSASLIQKQKEEEAYRFDQEKAWRSVEAEATKSIPRHLWNKINEHPIISAGFAATLISMGLMIRHRRDSLMLNYYGRWRLALQGLTFGALMGAMYKDERKRQISPYLWEWDFSRFKR